MIKFKHELKNSNNSDKIESDIRTSKLLTV